MYTLGLLQVRTVSRHWSSGKKRRSVHARSAAGGTSGSTSCPLRWGRPCASCPVAGLELVDLGLELGGLRVVVVHLDERAEVGREIERRVVPFLAIAIRPYELAGAEVSRDNA